MTRHVEGGVSDDRVFCGLGAAACTAGLLIVLDLCEEGFCYRKNPEY